MSTSRVVAHRPGVESVCDALISRIAVGNESAMADLCTLTIQSVYSIAYQATHDATKASDIVVEVYRDVWRMARHVHQASAYRWLTVLTVRRTKVLASDGRPQTEGASR